MIVTKKPIDCSKNEIQSFYNLILLGNQDNLYFLNKRIKSAEILGFNYIENEIAGVAALKNPDINYKNSVFKKANIPDKVNEYIFEIGYAYTKEHFRRRNVCYDLINKLIDISPSKKIFATTRINNTGMQVLLERIGFQKEGIKFKGIKEEILLYLLRIK